MAQLTLNLFAIFLAGVGTLYVQRRLYQRRRRAHLHDEAAPDRRPAGGAQPCGPPAHRG